MNLIDGLNILATLIGLIKDCSELVQIDKINTPDTLILFGLNFNALANEKKNSSKKELS